MADTWSGGVVASMNGESPPTVRSWQDVSVPGVSTVFADESSPIAYRRTFPDPRAGDDERAELELTGVYGRAHVWINDRFHGTHDGPIEPARFAFEPQTTNELVIACEPSASTAAVAERDDVPAEFAVPGIRDGVSVHRIPTAGVRSLQVQPTVEDDRASLAVAATVQTVEPVDDVVTFSLRPNGFRGGGSMDRTPIEAGPGEQVTVETEIDVRDPVLWWPRGLGPQHRYTLRAKVGDRSLERSIGLRTIDSDDSGLRINGRPVPARGVSLPPGTASPATIEAAAAADATLVRFSGHVPSRSLYEACDEAGLLVWQDLPIAPSTDTEQATTVADQLYGHRYGNPSLSVVGIRDGGSAPFDDALGTGLLARARVRWRAWRADDDRGTVDDIAAAVPADLVPIPLVGPPGTGPDVVRLAPGWRYVDEASVEWLLDRYVDDDTMGAIVSSPVPTPTSDRPNLDATPPGSAEPDESSTAVSADGGASTALDEQRSTALRSTVEALRRHKSEVVLVEPGREGGSNSAIADEAHRVEAWLGGDDIAGIFEPVRAVVDGRPSAGGTTTIWLVNETSDRVDATVTCRAADATEQLSVDIDAGGVAELGTFTIPSGASTLSLVVETDGGSSVNEYRL
ncbi:glycoside hydrolase family protein [Halovivax asiaticus JCM 14624]|uniref:beta-mannosidase n=1 Tax=Halovivax asiaticus JCM 14624 TaxID=1227490 RepID=M0BU81_9EURY|nr:glycoside hydrolase [Halovivax asiaticus]ELZ13677.1 glycoside hydrolase family protein [Halovivax asiaticus JCM 14624]